VRLAEPHTNSRGLAHGGFITAMADNAMGLSCGMKRDAGITRLITASLGVDFIASARIGQWVAFEPEIIKLGNNLCFVQCFVTADGARIARANGTFSVVTKRV
jgi:acyl-coenzyme A thioesterase PaaI-like protein